MSAQPRRREHHGREREGSPAQLLELAGTHSGIASGHLHRQHHHLRLTPTSRLLSHLGLVGGTSHFTLYVTVQFRHQDNDFLYISRQTVQE